MNEASIVATAKQREVEHMWSYGFGFLALLLICITICFISLLIYRANRPYEFPYAIPLDDGPEDDEDNGEIEDEDE